MKRLLLATVLALGLSSTACVVVHPAHSRSAVKAEKCPPGHVWSDGRCHDKGKGHDKH